MYVCVCSTHLHPKRQVLITRVLALHGITELGCDQLGLDPFTLGALVCDAACKRVFDGAVGFDPHAGMGELGGHFRLSLLEGKRLRW